MPLAFALAQFSCMVRYYGIHGIKAIVGLRRCKVLTLVYRRHAPLQ